MKLRLFGPVNISVDGPDCEIEIENVNNLTIEGEVIVQASDSTKIKKEFSSDRFVFIFDGISKKETDD